MIWIQDQRAKPGFALQAQSYQNKPAELGAKLNHSS